MGGDGKRRRKGRRDGRRDKRGRRRQEEREEGGGGGRNRRRERRSVRRRVNTADAPTGVVTPTHLKKKDHRKWGICEPAQCRHCSQGGQLRYEFLTPLVQTC